jgi:amino acid transporter
MLKRELSRFEGYATLIGIMVGAGIFVAIGEAGKDTGPATFLAYLILGPVTLLTALPYVVFGSTPIGNIAGGAYVHISRTFKSYFPGFIAMWLTWLTYIGVLSVLSISVGNYLQAFYPALNPKIIATGCLLFFYSINLIGVKNYGRLQNALFIVLISSILLIVVPGLFSLRAENFHPFFPKGIDNFTKALAVLFFAYAGFDALAQTAEETKSASSTLPRIFVIGILITVTIYVCISIVAFGNLPYAQLILSKTPVSDAARTYLPFGSHIAAVGALAAFLTTINACMMVPSRILYIFAEDRVAPSLLASVNKKFATPHVSLTINVILSLFLVWTHTLSYLLSISLQALMILYATECLALAMLPIVNRPLWDQVPLGLRKKWVIAAAGLAFLFQIGLYAAIPNPLSAPLIIWGSLGTAFYAYERFRGRRDRFDYGKNLYSWAVSPMPSTQGVTYSAIQERIREIEAQNIVLSAGVKSVNDEADIAPRAVPAAGEKGAMQEDVGDHF